MEKKIEKTLTRLWLVQNNTAFWSKVSKGLRQCGTIAIFSVISNASHLSVTIKEFIYLFIENNGFEREKLKKKEQLYIQRCSSTVTE